MVLRKFILIILLLHLGSIFSNPVETSWDDFKKKWDENSFSNKRLDTLLLKEDITQSNIKSGYYPSFHFKASRSPVDNFLTDSDDSYEVNLSQRFIRDFQLNLSYSERHFDNIYDDIPYGRHPSLTASLSKTLFFNYNSSNGYGIQEELNLLESKRRCIDIEKSNISNQLYVLSLYKSLVINCLTIDYYKEKLELMESSKAILVELVNDNIVPISDLWDKEKEIDFLQSSILDIENQYYDLYYVLQAEGIYKNISFEDFIEIDFKFDIEISEDLQLPSFYKDLDVLLKQNQLKRYTLMKKQLGYANAPKVSFSTTLTPIDGQKYSSTITDDLKYSLSVEWGLEPFGINGNKKSIEVDNRLETYQLEKDIHSNYVKFSNLKNKMKLLIKNYNIKKVIQQRMEQRRSKAMDMYNNDLITKIDLLEVEISMLTFNNDLKLEELEIWDNEQQIGIEYGKK